MQAAPSDGRSAQPYPTRGRCWSPTGSSVPPPAPAQRCCPPPWPDGGGRYLAEPLADCGGEREARSHRRSLHDDPPLGLVHGARAGRGDHGDLAPRAVRPGVPGPGLLVRSTFLTKGPVMHPLERHDPASSVRNGGDAVGAHQGGTRGTLIVRRALPLHRRGQPRPADHQDGLDPGSAWHGRCFVPHRASAGERRPVSAHASGQPHRVGRSSHGAGSVGQPARLCDPYGGSIDEQTGPARACQDCGLADDRCCLVSTQCNRDGHRPYRGRHLQAWARQAYCPPRCERS